MDPIENKTTHSYPNADRAEGIPENTEQGNIPGGTPRPVNFLTTQDNKDKTSAVHTFKDDLAKETSKGDFSITKILMANSKRVSDDKKANIEDGGGKNKNKIIIGISLAVFSIIIIGGFSYIGLNTAKTPTEVVAQKYPTQQFAGGILYTEQSVQIDISNKNRSSIYNDIYNKGLLSSIPKGLVESVYFTYLEGSTTKQINASTLLDIIAPSAPDTLKSNISNNYVFGYYSYESNEPFIILKAANYDSVFAGMLEWEKSMYADIGSIVFKKDSLVSDTQVSNSDNSTSSNSIISSSTSKLELTVATSTQKNTLATSSLYQTSNLKTEYDTDFIDKTILNNDARVLYRPNGKIAFYYTFFNKDTLIIATSEQTLREIIYRITSGKITR